MAKIPLISPPSPQRKPLTPKDRTVPLFSQLLPCLWRDVEFPIASIKVSFAQDLAEHKYWGVDGSRVEATGRAAMQIEAVIPFYNGIVPGKNEKWGSRYELYPTGFRTFLRAFANRSTGDLQHPELGKIKCKPQNMTFTIDAQRRDGVEVQAQWLETIEDDSQDLTQQSDTPIVQLQRVALDLDASEKDIRGLAPDAPVFTESFDSLVNKITGAIDKVSTTAALISNKPKQIMYRLSTLEDSLARAKTALTWPATDNIERMKASLLDVPKAITKGNRAVLRYTTPTAMTLSNIQAAIPTATTDDLIKLNPGLIAHPEVPANTVVRYFAP